MRGPGFCDLWAAGTATDSVQTRLMICCIPCLNFGSWAAARARRARAPRGARPPPPACVPYHGTDSEVAQRVCNVRRIESASRCAPSARLIRCRNVFHRGIATKPCSLL
jgi:hypothetical protein